jgi:hypothetical protein
MDWDVMSQFNIASTENINKPSRSPGAKLPQPQFSPCILTKVAGIVTFFRLNQKCKGKGCCITSKSAYLSVAWSQLLYQIDTLQATSSGTMS